MALPKITNISHELTLPVAKNKIRVRPFLVKEEKILMMAIESDDLSNLSNVLMEIIDNCIITRNIKCVNLTLVDIQYILIKLRAMSKGDTIELTARCNSKTDGGVCGHKNEIDINLDDLTIDKEYVDKDSKIKVNDKIGIKLRPPQGSLIGELSGETDNTVNTMVSIISCIEYIWEDEEIYYSKDSTQEEMEEFIGELPSDIMLKIKTYLNDLPKIILETKFKCEVCGHEDKIVLDKLAQYLK